MLLYKIIKSHKDELEVFKASAEQSGFIDMVNDFIADFKQQDCSLDELNLQSIQIVTVSCSHTSCMN